MTSSLIHVGGNSLYGTSEFAMKAKQDYMSLTTEERKKLLDTNEQPPKQRKMNKKAITREGGKIFLKIQKLVQYYNMYVTYFIILVLWFGKTGL